MIFLMKNWRKSFEEIKRARKAKETERFKKKNKKDMNHRRTAEEIVERYKKKLGVDEEDYKERNSPDKKNNDLDSHYL